MPPPSSLFAHHGRRWQDNRYVYPVISRRSRGLSIGINLSPDKRCNFDCVYCSVDRRFPGDERPVDLAILEGELHGLLALATSGELFALEPFSRAPSTLRRLNDIAFSGDAEPTASPFFPEACRVAVAAHAQMRRDDLKIVVITNATLLDRPSIARALDLLDPHGGEMWVKLDAGTEERHRRISRSQVPLTRILENIGTAGRTRPLVIQSMFLRLDGEGPSDEEIEAYLARLRALRARLCRIDRVQVYTVARATAEANVEPLPVERLEAIAERIRGLGLASETFGAP
jgi:wyosine [tRNA(Phe)-imidazoG37] synthetase (radical SAM superfamily)